MEDVNAFLSLRRHYLALGYSKTAASLAAFPWFIVIAGAIIGSAFALMTLLVLRLTV